MDNIKQISKSKYDFYKLKQIIINISKELKDNQYYYIEDLKEHELSKASIKLIDLIKSEEGFNDIFDNTQTVVLTNNAYTLSNYDIAKNSILNTLHNGIDDTIAKLNKLFSNSEPVYTYYTLLGIKINTEYKINDYIKLIPINSMNTINQSNSEEFFVTGFKDMIIKNAFNTGVALVLTDKIKIESHDLGKPLKFGKNKHLEIELISLLISLQTKTGCIIFENYNRFEDNCILSQPESMGLNECKFFPNDAADVSINIEELIRLLSDIKEFPKEDFEHLKRVLTMFSHACIKKNYIDSCIELRAILEAIFVGKGKDDSSYTHLICERGALFLEKEKENREDIFNELEDLYSLSSRVIHGEYKYREDDEKKIKKLKDLCFKSIMQTIKNKKVNKKKDWNNLIFE